MKNLGHYNHHDHHFPFFHRLHHHRHLHHHFHISLIIEVSACGVHGVVWPLGPITPLECPKFCIGSQWPNHIFHIHESCQRDAKSQIIAKEENR